MHAGLSIREDTVAEGSSPGSRALPVHQARITISRRFEKRPSLKAQTVAIDRPSASIWRAEIQEILNPMGAPRGRAEPRGSAPDPRGPWSGPLSLRERVRARSLAQAT